MRMFHAICGVFLLIALWQFGVWMFGPPRYMLPSPAAVGAVFLRQPFFLLQNSLITLEEIGLGQGVGGKEPVPYQRFLFIVDRQEEMAAVVPPRIFGG